MRICSHIHSFQRKAWEKDEEEKEVYLSGPVETGGNIKIIVIVMAMQHQYIRYLWGNIFSRFIYWFCMKNKFIGLFFPHFFVFVFFFIWSFKKNWNKKFHCFCKILSAKGNFFSVPPFTNKNIFFLSSLTLWFHKWR